MREIRFVAIIIAHDLNLLLRSTARIGSTCVPKQPHDTARKRRMITAAGRVRLPPERATASRAYVYSPIVIFVRRTVSSAVGSTLARPSASTESTYDGSALTWR
jgi:hypothetical protein